MGQSLCSEVEVLPYVQDISSYSEGKLSPLYRVELHSFLNVGNSIMNRLTSLFPIHSPYDRKLREVPATAGSRKIRQEGAELYILHSLPVASRVTGAQQVIR